MKKIITTLSALAIVLTFAGCTTDQHQRHSRPGACQQTHSTNHCTKHNKKANKIHTKMYTRNNYGDPSEIGYVKFYDVNGSVKMVVNVDNLRDGVDYTTKIYQCTDAKCTNPDTCCMTQTMSLEMPLTRKDKNNDVLQETFFINNVTTDQLRGATIFFERDNGYRAAWGFLD